MKKLERYIRKWILFFKLEKLLARDDETKEALELLYRRPDREKVFLEIWCRRILFLLAGLLVSMLFFLICYFQDAPEDVVINNTCIHREKGRDEVTFGVQAETEEGIVQDEITVDISREDSTEEGKPASEDENKPSLKEVVLAEVREAVEEAVQSQSEEENIKLPEIISGNRVKYLNPEIKRDYSVFYLSLLVLIIMPFLWKKKQKEQLCKREDELMLDYPELVQKIMLLLSAGLTVRGCFDRIRREYQRRLQEGGKRRYVYEEVCYACQEMGNGGSEQEAIEEFGKRCRQISYLRLSSIINQNIRKGSEGLIRLLEMEAVEALQKRKETVKRLGETAGTKLLLPMVLMLGVVMAIIIIPAFMTM